MHRHAARALVVIPAVASSMIVAVGCSSSGSNSIPQTSATAGTMSATAAACHKLEGTLAQAPATLGNVQQHPSSARADVTAFDSKLKMEAAASGNTSLTSAVSQFTSSVQKALASFRANQGSVAPLITALTQDSQKIVRACSNASG
jgi:hypothetical protein